MRAGSSSSVPSGQSTASTSPIGRSSAISANSAEGRRDEERLADRRVRCYVEGNRIALCRTGVHSRPDVGFESEVSSGRYVGHHRRLIEGHQPWARRLVVDWAAHEPAKEELLLGGATSGAASIYDEPEEHPTTTGHTVTGAAAAAVTFLLRGWRRRRSLDEARSSIGRARDSAPRLGDGPPGLWSLRQGQDRR